MGVGMLVIVPESDVPLVQATIETSYVIGRITAGAKRCISMDKARIVVLISGSGNLQALIDAVGMAPCATISCWSYPAGAKRLA